MPDVCCPQYLLCNPSHAPCPPCASPAIYIGLIATAVALVFWFLRNLHRPLLEQLPVPEGLPDQIPAIPDARAVCGSIKPPPDAEAAWSGSSSDEEDGNEAARPAELAPAFINVAVDRSGDIATIVNNMLNAFGGILLDIRSFNESNTHPANGVLIQSLKNLSGNTDRVQPVFGSGEYTIEPHSLIFDCWEFKIEEDAEKICRSEKDRKYIFLLNNTYVVWQMMCSSGASFSTGELTSRLVSMIQRYKKSYLDECWVPLNHPCSLDKFTACFFIICNHQKTWKLTAELKYKLRKEIVDLILPPYELELLAVEDNRSQISEVRYWLKRVMTGKKKSKKYTCEALEKVIGQLFEGETLPDSLIYREMTLDLYRVLEI